MRCWLLSLGISDLKVNLKVWRWAAPELWQLRGGYWIYLDKFRVALFWCYPKIPKRIQKVGCKRILKQSRLVNDCLAPRYVWWNIIATPVGYREITDQWRMPSYFRKFATSAAAASNKSAALRWIRCSLFSTFSRAPISSTWQPKSWRNSHGGRLVWGLTSETISGARQTGTIQNTRPLRIKWAKVPEIIIEDVFI